MTIIQTALRQAFVHEAARRVLARHQYLRAPQREACDPRREAERLTRWLMYDVRREYAKLTSGSTLDGSDYG